MTILSTLRYDFTRVREHLGLMPYTRPQEYDATYSVTVTNTHPHEQNISVLLPLPLETDYQQNKTDPTFNTSPSATGVDEKFGNRYAMWEVDLAPHELRTIGASFVVRVTPRKPLYDVPSKLDEYRTLADVEVTPFLAADAYVNGQAPAVRQRASDVLRGEKDVRVAAAKLYEHVRDSLTYGHPIAGLYSFQDALSNDAVDCGGFDVLLVSLYHAVGIPARMVSGFWAGYPKNEMHAWAEFLTPHSEWVPVDPSMGNLRRRGLTSKSGRFGFVGSDRIAFSVGSDLPVLVHGQEMRVPILQTPVVVAEHGEGTVTVDSSFITTRHV
ncbi:MAG: transglutaminase domain-containing protein [Candidatus Kerfeldbacteria bacterium]|nr:transglutaminase domain-containing protein [Candidatus Kerfeldbacteria bacterium]